MTERATPSPRWPLLVVTSAVVVVVHLLTTHATAWHFFDEAARLLVDRGPAGESSGLRLYADHPELQFGPLSIVLALPFTALGETAGAWAAMVASSGLGLLSFRFICRALSTWSIDVPSRVLTAAGVLFVVVWGDLAARTTHIDDAIALTAAAWAVSMLTERRGMAVAIALGIAAAAKPWAVTFAPLLLVPAWARARELFVRAAIAGGLVVLTWAPFVVAEPDTLRVAEFAIENDPTSTLRALGVDDDETPSWLRTTQLAGGLAAAGFVAWRGRGHAVILAAVSARLLVEPGAHRYYTAGAALGALLVELTTRPRRLPWLTALLVLALEVTAIPGSGVAVRRVVRLVAVVGALAAALTAPPVRALSPASSRSPARAPSWSSSSGP